VCCSVLVVDDVEINRELLRLTLENEGHQITMATNGQEAVDQFQTGSFDLIYMDIQMPVLDGFGAVRKIREIERGRGPARIPIVALTAHVPQGDREKFLAADMNAYLPKPAKPADILELLNQLVPVPSALNAVVNIKSSVKSEPVVPIEPAAPVASMQQADQKDAIPVFDRDELMERLGGREEMLGHFFAMFTKDVTSSLKLLQAAVMSDDREQIRNNAHTIKGASANISALRVREVAAAMESYAREGKTGDAARLLPKLTQELNTFNQEITP
jgi:CheY-like chemotaxis protein